MKPAPQNRRFKYQYRVVWGYKGKPGYKRTKLFDHGSAVLRILRRLATAEPWMGASQTNLRRGWARLALMLGVPFAAVADVPPKEVMRRIQAAYPELDYARVEFRQVGEWRELLDPLGTLPTHTTEQADKRLLDFIEKLEHMTPVELDTWRSIPTAEADEWRARHGRSGLDRLQNGLEGTAAATAEDRGGRAGDDTRRG